MSDGKKTNDESHTECVSHENSSIMDIQRKTHQIEIRKITFKHIDAY